jgi:hypothetical protein
MPGSAVLLHPFSLRPDERSMNPSKASSKPQMAVREIPTKWQLSSTPPAPPESFPEPRRLAQDHALVRNQPGRTPSPVRDARHPPPRSLTLQSLGDGSPPSGFDAAGRSRGRGLPFGKLTALPSASLRDGEQRRTMRVWIPPQQAEMQVRSTRKPATLVGKLPPCFGPFRTGLPPHGPRRVGSWNQILRPNGGL